MLQGCQLALEPTYILEIDPAAQTPCTEAEIGGPTAQEFPRF